MWRLLFISKSNRALSVKYRPAYVVPISAIILLFSTFTSFHYANAEDIVDKAGVRKSIVKLEEKFLDKVAKKVARKVAACISRGIEEYFSGLEQRCRDELRINPRCWLERGPIGGCPADFCNEPYFVQTGTQSELLKETVKGCVQDLDPSLGLLYTATFCPEEWGRARDPIEILNAVGVCLDKSADEIIDTPRPGWTKEKPTPVKRPAGVPKNYRPPRPADPGYLNPQPSLPSYRPTYSPPVYAPPPTVVRPAPQGVPSPSRPVTRPSTRCRAAGATEACDSGTPAAYRPRSGAPSTRCPPGTTGAACEKTAVPLIGPGGISLDVAPEGTVTDLDDVRAKVLESAD